MLVCAQLTQTIEKVWSESIHHAVKKGQKQCKKWPWPLSLICKIVMTLVEWVETIVHTFIQVIVTTICYVVQTVLAIASAILNLIVEIWLRLVGLADFFAGLIGILPLKNLRLHVVILKRGDGSLTIPADRVDLAVQRAAKILHDRARVKLVPTVHVMDDAAPAYALQVKSGVGFFLDLLSDAGAYYRQVIETKLTGLLPAFWLRFGTPVVAFVTDGVGDEGPSGCSSGPLGDYVCVEGGFMIVPYQYRPVTSAAPPQPTGASASAASTTLAHEIAHACGLLHDMFDVTNLMYANEFSDGQRGTNLSPFQRGIVRGSTHVTYF